jgi:SAM-dependent methyltransferase
VSAKGTNWFDQGGADYARYRPDYPEALAIALAKLTPDRRLAVDVGCGNGQFSRLLTAHFDDVIALDPSADQIAHAVPGERLDYRVAPAEALPVEDGSAGLIMAAQAAHWFDLPAFYGEVRRVATPDAVVALVSYGVMEAPDDAAIHARLRRFHDEDVGPWWPTERALVVGGYADIDFPFEAIAVPSVAIDRAWDMAQLMGYIATWSAVRRALDAGQTQLLIDFEADMRALWGNAERPVAIRWPISVRAGRVFPA